MCVTIFYKYSCNTWNGNVLILPGNSTREEKTLENTNSWNILLLTYLLTPKSRVLLVKLTGLQLVKKFPAFYGTRSSLPQSQMTTTYLSLS